MKVNLGCGDQYAPGWTNVDHTSMPHRADVRLDLCGALPWQHGELTHAYAGHLLEHLRVHQAIMLLEQLRPCVNGELLIVGPDVDVARGMQVAGTLEVTLDSLILGADRWYGDVHRWECSVGAIIKMLLVAGWHDVQELPIDDVPAEWPIAYRQPRWQCAVLARSTGE